MSQHQFYLQLTGVNCMSCINKIESGLKQQDPMLDLKINKAKDWADVSTYLSDQQVIELIQSYGYGAAPQEIQHYSTELINVSCQGCVNKITQHIHLKDPNAKVQVDLLKQSIQVQSVLTHHDLDELLIELDYKALISKKEPNTDTAQVFSNEATIDLTSSSQSEQSSQRMHFSLIGVTCASCVNSIDQAVKKLANVQFIAINFATRTAVVESLGSIDEIIEAIQKAGYDAKPIKADQDIDLEQSQAMEYKQKIIHSVIGLGIGLPLMLYGILGGLTTSLITRERIT